MNNNRTTSEQQANTIQEVLRIKEEEEIENVARKKFFENQKLVEGIFMAWRITLDQLNKMLDDFDLMILAEGKSGITDAEYRSYFQKWGAKRFSDYKGSLTKTTGMVF